MRKSFNKNKLNMAMSGVLVLATGSLSFAQPVYAAEQEEEESEKIVITGSRIQRSSAQMTTPTTVIGAAEIERTGATNLGEILHNLPASLDGIGATSINDNGTGSIDQAGMEFANLRGLGTNRTLVLVDGKRHVPGSAQSAAVDLGMIPAAIVERIEVISGAASAIYGSDAVTGVINIILKKEFQGTHIKVQSGTTYENDGDTKNLSLTWGDNFLNNEMNLTLNLDYSEEEEISMSARGYANRDPGFRPNPLNTGPDDGIPDTVFAQDVRFQALSEEGLIYVPNGDYLFGNLPITMVSSVIGPPIFADDPFGLGYDTYTIDRDDGSFRDFRSGIYCTVVPCEGGDGFRTQETNTLKTPTERVSFYASSNYDITADLRLSAELKYSKVESAASGQASVFHDDNFGPLIALTSDNPFRPQALADLMAARNLDVVALAVVGLNSRSENERETTSFNFAADGSFGEVDYNFYTQYGKVDTTRRSQDVLNERYYEALDAVADTSGNAVCRSGNPDCVAYNPINNLASQAAIDYVSVNLQAEEEMTQLVSAFSITSDLFDMPAGVVELAAGIEYRKETATSNPDPLAQARNPDGSGAGLVGSTTGASPSENSFLLPLDAEVSIKEIYAETIFPLVSDATFADFIDAELAVRYSDHSVTGGDSTYKAGLNWAFTDKFRSRLTSSKAVRAPHIQELFAPNQISGAFVTDPCHSANLALRPNDPNDPHRVNCAALGLAPDFQSEAAFGTRNLLSQGNPNLKPEEAQSFSFGFVYSPSHDFHVTVDYWEMEITDAITTFDASDVLLNCVNGASLNPLFCDLVNRDQSGQINSIQVKSINANKFTAEGIDAELYYNMDLSEGALSVSLKGTYIGKRDFQQNPDDPNDIVSRAGAVGTPKFRALINTVYSNDDYELAWTINHISESTFDINALPEQYPAWFDNKVEAF
ncbi:MAG: TonB-dependent receptor, partial [Kangiellaceae bacterium]|nr:TonB-dependent receptor [Kangiellaceae bacterium]